MVAVGAVAVAGPDAERHRAADAAVAALDLGLAVLVAEIDVIGLPGGRQPGQHPVHQEACLAVGAGAAVEASGGARNQEHLERALFEGQGFRGGGEIVQRGPLH